VPPGPRCRGPHGSRNPHEQGACQSARWPHALQRRVFTAAATTSTPGGTGAGSGGGARRSQVWLCRPSTAPGPDRDPCEKPASVREG
jgi:hypothetical protein